MEILRPARAILLTTSLVVVVASLLSFSSLLAAEVPESDWVGKSAVWKEGAVATLAESEIDIELIPYVTTVGEESGDLLWLARAWVRKQDVMTRHQALEHYTKRMEEQPDVARWRCRRGWVYLDQEEKEKAIADFDEALRLDPKLVLAYCGRGWINAKSHRAQAVRDCEQAIESDPKHPAPYRLHGILECFDEKYDEGIVNFTEAIELDGGYALDFANRANAWDEKKEYQKAIADFAKAIEFDPRPASIYRHRATTWRHLGKHSKVVDDCTAAIERNPSDSMLFYHRASALEKLSKHQAAIDDYEAGLRLDSKNEFCHIGLAGLLATCPDQKFRNGTSALAHATQACELTSYKDSNFLMFLAAACAESGDSENAVKWQEKSNELNKNVILKFAGMALVEHYRQGGKPIRKSRAAE